MPDWERQVREKNSAFYREHRTAIDAWLKQTWGPDKQTVRDFPRSRQVLEWQAPLLAAARAFEHERQRPANCD
jgi:hypothetical protein